MEIVDDHSWHDNLAYSFYSWDARIWIENYFLELLKKHITETFFLNSGPWKDSKDNFMGLCCTCCQEKLCCKNVISIFKREIYLYVMYIDIDIELYALWQYWSHGSLSFLAAYFLIFCPEQLTRISQCLLPLNPLIYSANLCQNILSDHNSLGHWDLTVSLSS